MTKNRYDVLVIGGGFFGLNIADHYAREGRSVLLCEREKKCMQRASYVNQARVHNGYHYPRSLLTAMRSRVSFPRFVADFPECVKNDFDKYYAIGKILGKVNATQFAEFCNRIGAECNIASQKIRRMFSDRLIEEVFAVKEYAFDAGILLDLMLKRTSQSGVEIVYETEVRKVERHDSGGLVCATAAGDTVAAQQVFNCTYSNLNFVPAHSQMDLIPLKYEMTEMALVEVPEEMQNMGVTVMCGPFFSVMPFPNRKVYSFSHVRYTPHYEWKDSDNKSYQSPLHVHDADKKISNYEYMLKDASRYMPVLEKCSYRESIWEVKTLLPSSETDDSRPILFKENYGGLNGFHCVMGGKIDNIYDILDAVKEMEKRK